MARLAPKQPTAVGQAGLRSGRRPTRSCSSRSLRRSCSKTARPTCSASTSTASGPSWPTCSTSCAASRCSAAASSSSSATPTRSSPASASSSKTTSPTRPTAARWSCGSNSLPDEPARSTRRSRRSGEIEDCNPPKDLRALDRRSTAKAAHGIDVDPDAAGLLAELIGDDLGRLDNELAKLAHRSRRRGEGRRRRRSPTRVAFQREQEMWDMTNELAAGNAAEALRRWRQLVQLDPSAEFRAVTWLGMWLEDVGTVLARSTARPRRRQAHLEVQGPPAPVHPHRRVASATPATPAPWTCWPRSTTNPSPASATPRPTSSGSSSRWATAAEPVV